MALGFKEFLVVLAVGAWVAFSVSNGEAQERPGVGSAETKRFVNLIQQWQQTRDPEKRIATLLAALSLERKLREWPLQMPRKRAVGILLRSLGNSFMGRRRGGRADNVERAIAAYGAALAIVPRMTSPPDWAGTQNNLGIAYTNRIRGARADNLEKAIAALENALTVYTRNALPRDWAATQNNLGNAYVQRVRGGRADNLERAIAAYQAALTVRTRASLPHDWADTQNNLGIAYRNRIRGARADNLEKAIAAYQAALTVRTRSAAPRQWAETQNNLGFAYRDRIRGVRADNLEKAIAAFEGAIAIFTRNTFPQLWAATQNNLGIAYTDRIRGQRAENLEKAITALAAALTVRTREALPHDWAQTQSNLGNAFIQRIRGVRADNLEKAIEAYQAALTVRTRRGTPRDWADTQNNLGTAYRERIRGARAENLEKAIAAFEATLTVRTRAAMPRDWAETQNNLGNAYLSRILGARADNLERAIAAYEAALTVRTREALPREWADTQINLGVAYSDRVRGERDDNLERSIAAYEAALSVFTREAWPQDWANAQIDLGGAYTLRIQGSRTDNLEKAVAAYEAALAVYTREAHPLRWAMTQNNLGIVYRDRIRGAQADNLEKAIAAYQSALAVFTRDGLPLLWAGAKTGLGLAYSNRVRGARAANLDKAITAYREALTVRTRSALPRDHLLTGRALGQALLAKGDWAAASVVYSEAREAFLLLFGQGLSEAESRDLIRQAGSLFSEAAFAAVQQGNRQAAFELLSEGKARLLGVTLRLQSLHLSDEKHGRLTELRTQIRIQERQLAVAKRSDRAAVLAILTSLRQALLPLIEEGAAGEHKAGSFARARAILSEGDAIVAPVITKVGTKILLVTRGKVTPVLQVIDLPELTTARLREFLRGPPNDPAIGGWLGAYSINYKVTEQGLPKSQVAALYREWLSAIDRLGPDLWRLFAGPLDDALRKGGAKTGARLIWLPTGALGLLPLGLAQNPTSEARFVDTYEILNAPSLQVLERAHDIIAAAGAPSLVALVDPTGDLPFTRIEGALVARHFATGSRAALGAVDATTKAVLAALKNRTYWHFSTHGTFDWRNPRQSALLLKDKVKLTIGRLLDADDLGHPRLVVLSACETGLYDISRTPDEFIGLPATFMALGSAGVIGTLWPVDDRATAFLMAKFYELHLGKGRTPSAALREAQNWLREATRRDLIAYGKNAKVQGALRPGEFAKLETSLLTRGGQRNPRFAVISDWLADKITEVAEKAKAVFSAQKDLDRRPFAHPYYWGGFIYTGL